MPTMLVSGLVGEANVKWALEKYRRLLQKKFGAVVGLRLFASTAGYALAERLWELEGILAPDSPDVAAWRAGREQGSHATK